MLFITAVYLGNIYIYSMTYAFSRYNASLMSMRFILLGIGAGLLVLLLKRGHGYHGIEKQVNHRLGERVRQAMISVSMRPASKCYFGQNVIRKWIFIKRPERNPGRSLSRNPAYKYE